MLVTGFEPFLQMGWNPSQEIVEGIMGREWGEGVVVRGEVLKVEYGAAGARVVELMEEFEPDVVLSVGVAARTEEIRLERVAININDSIHLDNAGEVRRGRRILVEGPEAYFSTLPVDELQGVLLGMEAGVVVSNHAGAFVCNHVFYTALHHAGRMGRKPVCGFLHVPLWERGGSGRGVAVLEGVIGYLREGWGGSCES
ncbi:pyroglutamyl-peptidase I [Lacunimicrobium album]